jgi:hypothetical protein
LNEWAKMSRSTNPEAPTFVVCIRNDEFEASLELRKLYQVLHDEAGERLNLIRVVDESGDDYLFPREYFAPVELSDLVRSALSSKR